MQTNDNGRNTYFSIKCGRYNLNKCTNSMKKNQVSHVYVTMSVQFSKIENWRIDQYIF